MQVFGEIPLLIEVMTDWNPSQAVVVAAVVVLLFGAANALAATAVHRSQRHITPPAINPIHLNGYRTQQTSR